MRYLKSAVPVILLLSLTSSGWSQLPQTRLKSIFPAGGQVGTTVELKLTAGDDLEEVRALHFTHPGITAQQKTIEKDGQAEPVANTFLVQIAPNVPAGIYEVRAQGLWGVSNPRRFAVHILPELSETEPNNAPDQAQAIDLGSLVNGTMGGGTDVDCFRFAAPAGKRVIIECLAQRIDSRMDAELIVLDAATGRRVAWSQNAVGDDPVVVLDVPQDREYIIQLHDHVYRNGSEYIYRLRVHAGPYLLYTVPAAGQAGSKTEFTLYGYNLPGGEQTKLSIGGPPLERLKTVIEVPGEPDRLDAETLVRSYESSVDGWTYRYRHGNAVSNSIRIGISPDPIIVEQEPNNEPAQAQSVTLPIEVQGQFAEREDIDWFTFETPSAGTYWIEAVGHRLGLNLDPVLVVEQVTVDKEGKEQAKRLTSQDDTGANLAQYKFDTQTDDPVYKLAAVAGGKYRVAIYDRYRQIRGNPQLRYRLSIRPETPDFRVVAVSWVASGNSGASWPISLRKGDSIGVTLYAFRKDGFTGPIDVRLEGLPPGVTSPGTAIGSGSSTGMLVLTAAENAASGVKDISILASARIDDPRAVTAVEAAAKQVAAAQKVLPDLRKKENDARQKRDQALAQRDEAKQKLDGKPDDANLKKQLQQKQQAFEAAEKTAQAAAKALADVEAKLAAAQKEHQQAQADAAAKVKTVTHPVRCGTIAISGANNVPSFARLSQRCTLSVMDEAAPFQLTQDVSRVEACASRQILVPIKLTKRNGFDNKITLTVAGLPKNANITVANTAIEKGQSEVLVPVFVKENAPPGTYSFWFQSTGQVSYSRNPQKVERLKQQQAQAAEQLKSAQEAAKQATAKKNELVKAATDATNRLKAAQQAAQRAVQAVQQKQKALSGLAPMTAALKKKAAEAAAKVSEAEKALAAAQKASQGDPENAELKQKLAAAEKVLTEAKTAVEQVAKEQAAHEQKLAAAMKALQEAQTAQQKAEAENKAAQAAVQQTAKAKSEAEAQEKTAQAQVKQIDAQKKAVDKQLAAAEKQAKPANKNHTPPTTPITLTVLPAPIKLTASLPSTIQRGKTVEATVKVERLNGFAGAVDVSIPLPPGVSGISGRVTIPADQTEAKIKLSAAADATEGDVKHLVLRGTVDFGGPRAVDTPWKLKVTK